MKKILFCILPFIMLVSGCMGGAQPTLKQISKQRDFTGIYVISNVNGLVIDIYGSMKDDDTPLILYSLHGGDNQIFIIERQEDLTYKITAKHSRLALTVNDDTVVQSGWKGDDNQKWLILESKDGIVKFFSFLDSRVLSISQQIFEEETEIGVSRDKNLPEQQFRLIKQF